MAYIKENESINISLGVCNSEKDIDKKWEDFLKIDNSAMSSESIDIATISNSEIEDFFGNAIEELYVKFKS